MAQPEDQARENIDRMLSQAGWAVQDPGNVHLSAHRGLAIRDTTLKQGHGFADYVLYVDRQAAGVIETKKEDSLIINRLEPVRQVVLAETFSGCLSNEATADVNTIAPLEETIDESS